jgi:hypothetical protein
MDLTARSRWIDYSRAKDDMFAYTDIKEAPWWVVDADVKKLARLNCIHHLLSQIPYQDLTPDPLVLPPRQSDVGYVRPPHHLADLCAGRVPQSVISHTACQDLPTLWPDAILGSSMPILDLLPQPRMGIAAFWEQRDFRSGRLAS